MLSWFSVILSIFLISPTWPIGQNPTIGDPFIIVNKKTNQLVFIDDGRIQKVYAVATGKSQDLTPEGKFTLTIKAKDPYYRKKNIKGGDKANPLGSRWMGFDAENTDGRIFGIHGNNNPSTIGKYITQGCIRMYEEDVQALYEKIPIGTKVVITNTEETFLELGVKYGAIKGESKIREENHAS